MWILILSIVTTAYNGAAITSVQGFTSETTCLKAADTWLKQQAANNHVRTANALCAKA